MHARIGRPLDAHVLLRTSSSPRCIRGLLDVPFLNTPLLRLSSLDSHACMLNPPAQCPGGARIIDGTLMAPPAPSTPAHLRIMNGIQQWILQIGGRKHRFIKRAGCRLGIPHRKRNALVRLSSCGACWPPRRQPALQKIAADVTDPPLRDAGACSCTPCLFCWKQTMHCGSGKPYFAKHMHAVQKTPPHHHPPTHILAHTNYDYPFLPVTRGCHMTGLVLKIHQRHPLHRRPAHQVACTTYTPTTQRHAPPPASPKGFGDRSRFETLCWLCAPVGLFLSPLHCEGRHAAGLFLRLEQSITLRNMWLRVPVTG